MSTSTKRSHEEMEELAAMANGKARQDVAVKTHPSSGYAWSRTEDEPGYTWDNKKARDEAARAWEGMSHKDRLLKSSWGDIFETVENEQARLASLKQQ